MTVTLAEIDYVDTGGLRVDVIISNLELLRDAVNELPNLEAVVAQLSAHVDNNLGLVALSFAFDAPGIHTILEAREHPDMKLKHIYICAGGVGEDTTVRALANEKTLLADPMTLKSSEKRGKVVIGTVHPNHISRNESLDIETSSGRRVTVHVICVHPDAGGRNE